MAAADEKPYLVYGPVEPSDGETAAQRLLDDRESEAKEEERRTPASFFGRLRTSSDAFAAAHSVERLDAVDEEPRHDFFRASRPFSGLVVRAIGLYEATSNFLDPAPQRGGAVNARS